MTFEALIQSASQTPWIDAEVFYARAYAHYEARQPKEASEFFSVLCARKPMEQRFWFGLAASLQECKEFNKAQSAWAMAALLNPNDPYPHFHAAQCAFSMNQIHDALLALSETRQIIAKDPDHPLHKIIEVMENQWRKDDSTH